MKYTVLLEEVADGVGAARVARRILDSLHQPFVLDGHEAFVGASIGAPVAPLRVRSSGRLSAGDGLSLSTGERGVNAA